MQKKWVKRLKTKSGAFVSLLAASYIVFLIIMFLCVLLLYANAEKLISTEVEKSNASILANIRDSMDSKFNDLKNFTFNMLNDMTCIEFVKNGELDKLDERSLASYLKRQMVYASPTSHLYITSYQSERVISYDGVWDSGFLYDSRLKNSLTRQTFSDLRRKPVMAQFFQYTPVDSDTQMGIGCTSSFFETDIWSKPLGDVTVLVDASLLTNLISLDEASQSVLYLINRDGTVLFSTGDTAAALPEADQIPENGSMQTEIGRESYILSTVPSSVTPWTYVYLSPKGEYWRSTRQFRFFTATVFLLFLALGIAAAVYFAKKNSVPVKKLITELGIQNQDTDNEFAMISQYAKELIEGKKALEKQMVNESHIIQDTLLLQILTGHIKEDEIAGRLEAYGLRFRGSCFTVVLCRIEDFSQLYDYATDEEFSKAKASIDFLLGNVGVELYTEAGDCCSTTIEQDYAFILCTKSEIPDRIAAVTKKLRDFFQNQLKVRLSLAVSDSHTGPRAIRAAYQQALRAMEYRFIFGENAVIRFSDCARFTNSYIPFTQQKDQYLHCVRSGDTDGAAQAIADMFDLAVSGNLSLEGCKAFTFDLISTSLSLMSDQSPHTAKRDEQMQALLRCETMAEVRRRLISYMGALIVSLKELSNNRSLSSVVLRYIEQNYQDPDLNVNAIGQYMDMAPSYISKIFKEQIGTPLSSYIHLVRISMAKKLLQETQASVEAIAFQVGYASGNTMIRTFKRFEGITPGQYRARS